MGAEVGLSSQTHSTRVLISHCVDALARVGAEILYWCVSGGCQVASCSTDDPSMFPCLPGSKSSQGRAYTGYFLQGNAAHQP